MDTDLAFTIRCLLADCEQVARSNGWKTRDYYGFDADLEYVVSSLGRKPTRAEWAEAGLHYVGSNFVAED